jgi:hypothetical protein
MHRQPQDPGSINPSLGHPPPLSTFAERVEVLSSRSVECQQILISEVRATRPELPLIH